MRYYNVHVRMIAVTFIPSSAAGAQEEQEKGGKSWGGTKKTEITLIDSNREVLPDSMS